MMEQAPAPKPDHRQGAGGHGEGPASVVALIEARGLRIARAGHVVINALDLRLDPGRRLALTGATGSGKSTLLHALMGFVPVLAGHLSILGRPCRQEADFAPLRGPLGLLFQDPGDQLIGPSVLDDVAFGPRNQGLDRRAAHATALSTLDRLGLAGLASRPVHHLSGGQQRLICLAGVLAMRPHLLLLDEPTVGLDEAARGHLLELLLATGLPMIVATHDPHCVAALATDVHELPTPAGG